VLEKLSLKSKFFIPMVILISILLSYGGILFYTYYTKSKHLSTLSNRIELMQQLSNVLHELQKERGVTTGYLLNKESLFFTDLIKQRKNTDEALKNFLTYIRKHRALSLNEEERLYFQSLRAVIEKIRRCIDNGSCDYKAELKRFTTVNAQLLTNISHALNDSHIPAITRMLLTYINLLYMKEYLGLERAEGVAIFTKKELTHKELLEFYRKNVQANERKKLFLSYASEPIRKIYEKNIIHSPAYEEIRRLREIVYQENLIDIKGIDPHYWFMLTTDNLNKLHKLSENQKENLQHHIRLINRESKLRFVLVMSLSLFSFFIFFLMIIAFLRLYKEEQKLRGVFEKYIISSITDLKGRIISVSQAFCDISGYTKEELIGQPHNIVRHPDMPREAFKELWDNLKQGKSWSGKIKNRKKDGGFYWVYAHIEPLYDNKGDIEAYIAIRLDITESELLHEKVVQKERENKAAYEMMLHQSRLAQMGELLSMIAHQWRQPLNAITVAVNTMRLKAERGKLDKESILKTTDRITTLVAHLNQTINDFRNFFRPEKSQKLTTFTSIIKTVKNILGKTLEAKGIEFYVDIKNDAEFICYENELVQVILNIVKNAEDAILEKGIENGYVKITVDDFIITIEDNAGGIPEEFISKIFDPYFSTKTQKDGTGLGLYMSKTIVEDHCEGFLIAENGEEGARFKIVLQHLKQSDVCRLLPNRTALPSDDEETQ
jgi:PAS domain S-box-containing protein